MAKFPSESRRSGRLARMVVFAAATAVSMAAVGQARADVTDQLLDQLRAKGVLTHGEYSKLKSRHAAEKAEMDRPYSRHYSKDGVVVVPDDRYLTRLDKGIGFHIPGLITKEGEVGAIDVKISGDLIFGADETFNESGNHTIASGLVTASPNQPYNSIQAGLLPSAIVLSIATNQMGYDLGFTIGAYTGGTNTNTAAGSTNANNPGARCSRHARHRPSSGLRHGRHADLRFGQDRPRPRPLWWRRYPERRDIVGPRFAAHDECAAQHRARPYRHRLCLCRLAAADRLYDAGLQWLYGDDRAMTPYNTVNFAGTTPVTATFGLFSTLTGQELPEVQAQIKWKGNIAPGAALTVSGDALWQQHKDDPATGMVSLLATWPSVNSWGVDGFGKLDIDGFSFVAYGYYGEGLGTTGFFFDGFDFAGNARNPTADTLRRPIPGISSPSARAGA